MSSNRNENGQALVIALLALALGVVLVVGFLYYATTSQRATRAVQETSTEHYSADAGVEYGLWLLKYGGLTNTLTITDPQYITTVVINNTTVTVTVVLAEP